MKNSPIALSQISTRETNESIELEYEFFQNFESIHTRKSYRTDIKGFIGFISTEFELQAITECKKVHIVAYRNWLSDNDYSPKSINRKISSVSTYFNFLSEKGFVEINPCMGVKKPRQVVVNETNDLTDDEVINLLEIVSTKASELHRAIIYLFFSTGIRKSELIELKLKDFEEIDGEMTIRIRAKGGKKLTKLIAPECFEVIKEYIDYMSSIDREIHPNDWLFQPSKNPSSSENNVTKPLRPKSIDYIFKKYCKIAGINKRISPHSARATYIGSAIENGANIIKISKDVGHSSIKTTEEYNKRKMRLQDSPAKHLGFLKKPA